MGIKITRAADADLYRTVGQVAESTRWSDDGETPDGIAEIDDHVTGRPEQLAWGGLGNCHVERLPAETNPKIWVFWAGIPSPDLPLEDLDLNAVPEYLLSVTHRQPDENFPGYFTVLCHYDEEYDHAPDMYAAQEIRQYIAACIEKGKATIAEIKEEADA